MANELAVAAGSAPEQPSHRPPPQHNGELFYHEYYKKTHPADFPNFKPAHLRAGGHAVAQTPLALALPGAGSRLSTQQRANRAMQSLSRRYSMEFGDVKAVIERWNSKKSTLCNCPQKMERKAGSKAGRKVHKPGCLHKKYMEMQSEYKEQLRDS